MCAVDNWFTASPGLSQTDWTLGGEEEPMQLGRAWLTPEERRRRQQEGRCFYCRETNHLVAACPTKRPKVVSQLTDPNHVPRNLMPIKVKHHDTTMSLGVLIDSGADESLMDWDLAQKLKLNTEQLSKPLKASCYHHLREVFSKTKAMFLPLHRPYDCAIDLIPGSTIPKGHLYLYLRTGESGHDRVHRDLTERGANSPHQLPGPFFFFVAKKDGSLRPCIDYSLLNDITIKNCYPLPLMSSVFDQLHQAKIFTKLDLRNAYHLVRIREGDEWKTGFNTPRGHYEYLVMPFGLNTAPAVFQAMINDILRDFLDHFVYIYFYFSYTRLTQKPTENT